jgi:hypothetical protein
LLNLGGGIANPSTDSQSQNFLGNGFNVNGGLYIPLLTFGHVGTGLTVGPNVSGTFSKFKQTMDGFPTYKISGQTGDTKPIPALDGNPLLYTIETGLHANFSFGKVTISPVLNGAYFNFKQDAFNVKQTNQVNGKEYIFDLYSQQKTEKSGFAFIPKLRVGYFPGSLGFYLESNYTLGPDVSVEQSRLQPLGTGNDKDGSYQLDQLKAGKQVVTERHTPFHNLAVNFGITYSFRRAAKKAARKTKSTIASSATVNPIYQGSGNSGQNPMSEPQNQSIVNTTKSNTKDRAVVLNNELMQVTYTGQDPILKNTKLSILGSGKTLSNGTPIVAGREVITGSVIISSGSSRITNTITIKQPETGDEGSAIIDNEGNFTVNLGSDTLHRIYINGKEFGKIKIESEGGSPQNQSIVNTSKSNTKDRIASPLEGNGSNIPEDYRNGDSGNMTYSSERKESPLYQAQNTEHMSPLYKGSLARPGEPIGGIIVKGGRNPGGQMKLTTNSNGEFTFENAKPADFQFTIETKETNTGDGNNARPGTPIGGIIVKGGKNSRGQMFTLTSDANGVVTLKNLPAGNYKFRVTVPTEGKQYESFRKGWDGTVKGGSK